MLTVSFHEDTSLMTKQLSYITLGRFKVWFMNVVALALLPSRRMPGGHPAMDYAAYLTSHSVTNRGAHPFCPT